MGKIIPKLDFRDPAGAQPETEDIINGSSRDTFQNALSPLRFNEYDTLFMDISTAMGDVDFEDIDDYVPGITLVENSIGAVIRAISDRFYNDIHSLNETAFLISGGNINGEIIISGDIHTRSNVFNAISSTGRVGIGTDNPSTALDVRGDIYSSGNANIVGNTVLAGSLTLPNSSSMAPTAQAQIGWNNSSNTLVAGTGSVTRTMVDTATSQSISNKTFSSVTINSPASINNATVVTPIIISASLSSPAVTGGTIANTAITGGTISNTSITGSSITTDSIVIDNNTIHSSASGKTFTIPDVDNNSTFIMSTGTQTLNGEKTFGSFPVLPSSAPVNTTDATHKGYVDSIRLYDYIITNQAEFDSIFGDTVYTDWYLPSRDELDLVRTELTNYGIVPFRRISSSSIIFSSSEYTASAIYVSNLEDSPSYITKNGATFGQILPFRSFTSTTSYNVRDRGPAGGWILYKNGNNYIECSANLTTYDQYFSQWSNITSELVGTSTNIGTGLSNSIAITEQSGHTLSIASRCLDVTYGIKVIPENTSIFIKRKDTPYLLNAVSVISSGVKILSDGAVVNRGTSVSRFMTTHKNQSVYSSGGVVGTYTVLRTAGTPYEPKDIVTWNGIQFYTVVSDTTTVSTGGTVTLSTPIETTAASTSRYMYSCQKNILTDGWIFDGQNNVNNLGGSFESGYILSGGGFYIPYCTYSTFKSEVRNCMAPAPANGGAYHGAGVTYSNIIENISNCSSLSGGGVFGVYFSKISNICYCSASTGGGCYSCQYSDISNINYCSATTAGGCGSSPYSRIYNISHCVASEKGGGCYGCTSSNISNIYYCSSELGGGCYECNYSSIDNIRNCTASDGGGTHSCFYSNIKNISFCTASNDGGGSYGCFFSTITDIYECSSTNSGGGCFACSNSIISNIYNCTAGYMGGGCHTCNNSTISNILACTATNGSGGGCYNSTYVTLSGRFNNEGTVDNIASCSYIGHFIYTDNSNTQHVVHTTALTTTDLH